MQDSDMLFTALFEIADTAVYICDVAGRILDVNQAAAEQLGFQKDDFLELDLHSLGPVEGRADVDAAFESLRATGAARFETVHIHRNGAEVPVEISGRTTQDSGKPLVLIVTRDRRERRELEAHYLDRQRAEALRRITEAVVHDFNNAITVISGQCDLALSQVPLTDPARVRIEEIGRAAERATVLVRHFATSKGPVPDGSHQLDLSLLVGESGEMLRALLDPVEVQTELDESLPLVTANPAALQKLLMNLACCAREAMPGGGKLRIETRAFEVTENSSFSGALPLGPCIRLSVAHSGAGMEPELRARVFEPAFTTKGNPAGFGLAEVYRVVRQYNGHITVESVPERGTTFRIYFPGSAGEPACGGDTAENRAEIRGDLLLLVEDDASMRRLSAEVLRLAGYRVCEAAGAEQAIAISERHGVSIRAVITDVTLQGTSGCVLAEMLREKRPSLPVLFTSGYSLDELAHHGSIIAEQEFLAKPFRPLMLTEKVEALMRSAKPRLLLVDDQSEVRSLLREFFEKESYACVEAANGREALNALAENSAQVVITDIVMPDSEGLELIREIRRLYPAVRMVAMSGAFGGQFLHVARLLGAHAVLAKPFKRAEALASVERALQFV